MASLPTDVYVAACQLIETPSAMVTIPNLNGLFSSEVCAALTKSGLLVDAPYLQDIEVEYEGELRSYPVERHDGNWRYFLQGSGWIQVSSDSLKVSRVDFSAYLKAMMSALDFEARATPEEIEENGVWYLGQTWLKSRKTHIVYVRRLGDESTVSALTGFLEDRHKSDPALILTTGKNLPAYLLLPGQNRIVTLDDAINLQSHKLTFKTDYLAKKMGASVNNTGFSDGFRTAYINGKNYEFSNLQAQIIEVMSNAGRAMHKSEIMSQVESTQEEVKSAFRSGGKYHPAWGVVIKNDNKGNYRLEF